MTFSNRMLGLGRMALILSAGVALMAQESGAVSGVVTSANGQPISGAIVVVKSPQLISPRTFVTGADGVYRVPLLPSGDYTVSVSAQGFIGAEAKAIRVGLGGKMSQDFTLKTVKAASATVEVVAAEATVDKTDTKTASNFSEVQLTALPAADRSFFGAADLAPGAITTSTGSITLRGGTTQSTIYNLNGVSIGDDYQGQQYNARVLDDAVEDVQVVQSPLNARYGRTGGGIINVESKSGGNTFEGTIRTLLTRDDWHAWRPYQRATGSAASDVESTKQYQITFSGPVVKDKLWFAVQSIQQPSVTSNSSILAGENPSNWGAGYYLNPGDLATIFGLPSEHYYAWDIGKPVGSGYNIDHIDVKLTYALTQDHTFTYEYYRRKETLSNQNPYGIPIVATLQANSLAQTNLYKTNAFSYKGVLSPTAFLEASYSLLRSDTVFPSPDYDHVRVYSGATQYGVIFPYGFNIAPGTDARDNQSGEINLKLFKDWHGSHEIDMGVQFYEFDRGTQTANGPNNSRYYVNYATADPAELNFSGPLGPGASPFTTWRPWNPGTDPFGNSVGFLAATQADEFNFFGGNAAPVGIAPYYQKYYGQDGTTKNRTSSIYVNDQWTLDSHWNVMGGLRMDRMKVYDTDGSVLLSYNTPVSPRLQVRYDLNGDSARLITFTAAKYFEDFRAGFTDAFVKKANTTFARWGWTGAQMPGGWAAGTIGLVNYSQLTNPGNYTSTAPYLVSSSAYNNLGMGSLSAPYTLEYTLGYRRNFNDGSYVSVNYVHRDWKNQFGIQQEFNSNYLVTIPDFTNSGLSPQKGFATLYTNSDKLTRRYNALELEFANKISSVWTLAGSLTLSRLTGNQNGGDSNSQGFRDNTSSAPLFLNNWLQNQGSAGFTTPYTTAQFAPDGVLLSDQTFKGRISLMARKPIGKGFMTYSWLLRYDSGTSYSAVMNNKTNAGSYATSVGLPSNLFPGTVPIFYSGRGAFRFNDTYQVDFKLGYEVPMGVGKTRLMGDVTVTNLFNHQQQAQWNTGFSSSTVNQTAPITVAQQGANGFGYDQYNYANYIPARSVAASIGLRF